MDSQAAKLSQIIGDALARLSLDVQSVNVEAIKDPKHGDYSSNVAMVNAKRLGMKPRELAQQIVDKLEDSSGLLSGKPEIAGPGFLNFRLSKNVFQLALHRIWTEREKFGQSNAGQGKPTMVEFVSANPTGPMHVGHGRGAVIGDVTSNLLVWAGY
jgi:arginyl-tRNA synthetase